MLEKNYPIHLQKSNLFTVWNYADPYTLHILVMNTAILIKELVLLWEVLMLHTKPRQINKKLYHS